MPSYLQLQRDLMDDLETQFKQGKRPCFVNDRLENYEVDNRICLTTVSYLPKKLVDKISRNFIEPLKKADPKQYYYNASNLHITLLTLFLSSNPKLFTDDEVIKIRQILSDLSKKYSALTYRVEATFEMPNSISLRAYASIQTKNFIKKLIKLLKRNGIKHDVQLASDAIFFGCISICRFKQKPNQEFQETLEKLKSKNVGTLVIKKFKLLSANVILHPQFTTSIDDYQFTK